MGLVCSLSQDFYLLGFAIEISGFLPFRWNTEILLTHGLGDPLGTEHTPRITESFGLEGTSQGYLVQPPCRADEGQDLRKVLILHSPHVHHLPDSCPDTEEGKKHILFLLLLLSFSALLSALFAYRVYNQCAVSLANKYRHTDVKK